MADPNQVARKWNSRLKAANTEIREGVLAVTESPMAKAAANPQKWVNGVTESVDKWVAGLGRVSLQEWQDRTLNIGLNRIAAGADAAVENMVEFYGELEAFQATIDRELAAMPDVNLGDSIARMTHQVTRMSEFTRRG